ncbi:hypothetical protein BCV70DRAFT_164170 [Testicularia cyperi]|uniref:Uncharacterized protein n=1 Tax=Testicularia cyperi TaxID=1882483 RepID=A0A317XKH7_9BASI|nr:hypothetical protein BCV70DRAFT_164170 [Testicularia cyperi]
MSSEETIHASSPGLMEPAELRARTKHVRKDSTSTSESSSHSSDFDREGPSQDDFDIDNTPATSYGGFAHNRSDNRSDAGSTSNKSDAASQLSNAVLAGSSLPSLGTDDDPGRIQELNHEVESLFDKLLPEMQARPDGDNSTAAEPTLLSRNLPAILTEFERQRGHALIDPKVYTQLGLFVEENPEVPITSDMLVNLIHALESSAQFAPSDDLSPSVASFSDRERSIGIGNMSIREAGGDDELDDLSQDEHLIRDPDSSRDSARDTSAEAAIIRNMKEDLHMERAKNDALQQTLSDKERRVNALEHKLVTLQEQYEESMLEEQNKVDDLQNQIQALKRDEKELRIKHRELQEQNASFESELASVTAQLEASEKSNAKLRRDLEDESDQTQKVKEDLDRRVKEYKELSGYLDECEAAKNIAEKSLVQLKQDLEKSRADASKLQDYRDETEALRETVDKLEMELDEVRRVTSLHSKDSSLQQQSGNSNPPTLTRRLGNELARTIDLEAEHSSGEDTQVDPKEDLSNVDDFIETVIQRRRRRVGKTRRSVEFATQSIQTEEPPAGTSGTAAESKPLTPVEEEPAITTNVGPSVDKIGSKQRLQIALGDLRLLYLVAALFTISVGVGLVFNTSRDLYHIKDRTFDAEGFRRLNYLPKKAGGFYHDERYPDAVVGSNFADDYVSPVLDVLLRLVGLGTSAKNVHGAIVY